MKKLLLIFTLLFSVTFSLKSYADFNWEYMGKNVNGHKYYIDLSSAKILGASRFYYRMRDFLRPDKEGQLSSKIYIEVNCDNLSDRYLQHTWFKEPMGNGTPSNSSNDANQWEADIAGSIGSIINKYVCNLPL